MTFVPLGDPLPSADAAYLVHELRERGIEARMAGAEEEDATVEVDEASLAAATALRDELFEAEPEAGPEPKSPARRKALLAAATAAIAILYLSRPLHRAIGAALAIVVGVIVFQIVDRVAGD